MTARSAALGSRLQAAWTSRGWLPWLLWPLSLLYRLLMALRRAAFRRGFFSVYRAPVPVVVVGNVIAGGGGKTPTVVALAGHLSARGWRVGIVSRGHGRSTRDCREVRPDSLPAEVGDEPALIRRRTGVPVWVAARRADAVRQLLARYPDTQLILCDDGLQHLALARDLEIVVFDDRATGNGWLLPAGPLREPWPRAGRAMVLDTGSCPCMGGWSARRVLANEAVRADGTRVPLSSLQDQPLHAVAGIARPEGFFAMLRARGLTLAVAEGLPDHYDFDSWLRKSHKGFQLVCTEKDALKLWRRAPDALAVPLHLEPEPAFLAELDARLHQLRSDPSALHHGQKTA